MRAIFPRWRISLAVAHVTFREILRDKILYNVLLFTVLLFAVAFLASQVSFTNANRVILDVGISAVNLGGTALAILMGAGLINRELERRTIYVALSHPISRLDFVVGKCAGLILVLVLNWALMCAVDLGCLYISSGTANIHATLAAGLYLLLLQSVALAGLAVLFSCLSTTSVAVMLTFGLFLVGNNVSQIRLIAAKDPDALAMKLMNAASYLIPNLETFQLGTKITYGIPVSGNFLLYSSAYALIVLALCLKIAGIALDRREI